MDDWNWFFSTLSQSTAAIIGIFGAFIFTKLINNRIEFKKKQTQLAELINHSKNFIDLISRNSEELDTDKKLIYNLELHILTVNNLLIQIKNNPEYSLHISIMTAFNFILFLCGVILPLLFIPIETQINYSQDLSILKFRLIDIITTLYLIANVFVIHLNLSLKYGQDQTTKLESFSEYDNYFGKRQS